jgi:phosphate-selective porin OprO/OprP
VKARLAAWILGLASLGLSPGLAEAQPPVATTDPLAEILARLEKLEKENASQRKAAGTPVLQSAGSDPGSPLGGQVDRREVEQIIGAYLKAQAERRQAEEEAQRKEEADAGFEVGKSLEMSATWRHGFEAYTKDRAFRVHIGGRTQIDAVWMNADRQVMFGPGGVGPVDDAVAFRRARFLIEGQLWEVISFMCEYDFLNSTNTVAPNGSLNTINTPAPTDLWIQVDQLPYLGHVRVGNQKPPIGFEHLTSSRWLNFIERSFGFDAFIGGLDNGFRPGIAAFNTLYDDRVFWSVGLYKNNQTVFGFNVGDGEWDLTARLTGLPIYEQDGACLVHLGVGVSHRDMDRDQVRFRARTLLRNGPAALHTPLLDLTVGGTTEDIVVPEFVVVWGPWTLQSEYMAVWTQNTTVPAGGPVNLGTQLYQSAYVQVLYFLTGEHRRYDVKYPRFDRVIPNENFFFVRDDEGGHCCGWGAWQIGVRYDWIDLNGNGVNGGIAQDFTAGLNWFWNPNSKVQFNYSLGHRDLPTGDSNGFVQGFGIRFAFDF